MSIEMVALLLAGFGFGAVAAPMWVSALRYRSGGSERSSKDMETDALLKAQREQIAETRKTLAETELKLRVLHQWVTELCAQMVDAGLRPITELEVRRKMGLPNGSAPDLARSGGDGWLDTEKALRDVLLTRFGVDELRILAIDTGIGEEALVGESKTAKVLALLARAREMEVMRRLVAAVERARPGSTYGWRDGV